MDSKSSFGVPFNTKIEFFNVGLPQKATDRSQQEIKTKDIRIFHPRAFGNRIAILILFGKTLDSALYQRFIDFLPQFNAQTLLFISKAVDFRMKKLSFPLKRRERNEEIEMLEFTVGNGLRRVNDDKLDVMKKWQLSTKNGRFI